MAVYYVDNIGGTDGAEGKCPACAVRDYKGLALAAGDTVLFKRGTIWREQLEIVGGAEDAPITYGAYGEGEDPTFSGGVDLSSPDDWTLTERENVWLCTRAVPTDVGNFAYGGEYTAELVWEEADLCKQGQFYDSRVGECNQNRERTVTPQRLLVCSVGNPALVYSSVEAIPYAKRSLGVMQSHTRYEGLRFISSGVHGLTAFGDTRDVVVRGCTFEGIGGCGWSRERRIRFGNGIEFWIGAEDVLIENNVFKHVYDSCATHQGPDGKTPPARNFHVRGNLFDTYSMAAFEYRAQMMIDSSFTNNVCRNAGCGFGMLGESLPRKSEIYPQPMGHHVFLWRMPVAPEGGSLLIEGNDFGAAPNGAAIYSIICPEAEAQITFRSNTYSGERLMTAFFGGEKKDSFL